MTRTELEGIAAAKGLVFGRASVRYPMHFEIEHGHLNTKDVPQELERFEQALQHARAELDSLSSRIKGALSKDIIELVHAHRLILDDPEFSGQIAQRIRREKLPASAALKLQRDQLVALFDAMEDPYLRSRREDIDQVALRLYNALKHRTQENQNERRMQSRRATKIEILVCESIAPDDLASAHEHGLRALVLTGGSIYSHTAILARSLSLVLVCGVHDAFSRIQDGDEILVDGEMGHVVLSPDVLDQRRAQAQTRSQAHARKHDEITISESVYAKDGTKIELHVNAERLEDIARAMKLGARGVGLFRTEFLYLGRRDAPTENEQFRIYRDALKAVNSGSITFRTLDLGADKAAHAALELAPETNPALGLRGIRHSLSRPDLFEIQLRALLRASVFGDMRILLPMVSNLNEIRAVRSMLEQIKMDLSRKRIAYANTILLGAMIEIPAAALIVDELASEADFFAIGSNDLAQYLLAADRNNDSVAAWYQPDHLALDRLIKIIVAAAKKQDRPLSLCGEIASDPQRIQHLVELGVRQFSMHVTSLGEIHGVLRIKNNPAV